MPLQPFFVSCEVSLCGFCCFASSIVAVCLIWVVLHFAVVGLFLITAPLHLCFHVGLFFFLMVILWSYFLNTNRLPNVVFVCICLFLRVCICCSFSTGTEFEKYSNTSSRQVIHHLLTLTLFFLRIYIQAVMLLR